MEHVIMCPQCNAPLAPHRFARSIVCTYCGATVQLDEASVSAANFKDAFLLWNSPQSYQLTSWISLGDQHWAIENLIAQGDISDVYTGRRARFPTELAIIKLLRDPDDVAPFDNEWEVLQLLQRSEAKGAKNFRLLLPQPIMHGDVTGGMQPGRRASIFRRQAGFRHTLEEVIRAYPKGIPPQASIWVWRRILEILSFIHASGMVHRAVLPRHLLIQENDHGMRLVGYSAAGRIGEKAPKYTPESEDFRPQTAPAGKKPTPQIDHVMSARCLVAALGGDPATASLPKSVPKKLADIVQQIALADPVDPRGKDAWSLREELGKIATDVFGAPKFTPIVMPD